MTVDHDPQQASDAPEDADDATASAQLSDTAEPESADLVRELSRAMHRAALAQHKRMVAEVAGLRSSQAEAIKTRTAGEADQLKLESDADIEEIDLWARTATEMIAEERVRRMDARRERLMAQLARQELIAERELMAVDVTLEDHEAALEAFFNQLEGETDPTAIARLASTMPSLPSLSEAADAAKRHAISEFAAIDDAMIDPGAAGATNDGIEVSPTRLMAVMDPDARRGSPGATSPTWPEPHVVAVAAGDGHATEASGSLPLLRSIPTARPIPTPDFAPDPGDGPTS